MTIIKSLSQGMKPKSTGRFTVFGIRAFIGILEMSTILYLFNFFDSRISNDYKFYYGLLSTAFYILFFVFLSWYIKISTSDDSNSQRIKWLIIVQWISISISVTLIYISAQINTVVWPEVIVEKVLYLFNTVWPNLFVPNLSFIIITTMIFYTTAILRRNRDLKQENDLTI